MSDVLSCRPISERIDDRDWEPRGEPSVCSSSSPGIWDFENQSRHFHFPLRGQKLVVEVRGNTPPWFYRVVSKIVDLHQLNDNWNSYGAKRVRPSSIGAAIEFLGRVTREETPEPIVVPTARGTVLLEWHTGGIDLEIDVLNSGTADVVFEAAGEVVERRVGADVTPVAHWIERLSR